MSTPSRINFIRAVLVSVTCLLTACGGGSGPAPAPAPAPAPQPPPEPEPEPEPEPPAPSPPPPGPPPPPNFDTNEYRQNYGLDSINAIAAYDDGLTGDGITVAVIDSGYHADFTDLIGNISPNSIDIIPGRNDLGGGSEHGSIVATVIAAEKNGVDVHGVAFESEILAIRTDSPDACDDDGCGFFDNDIASAVDYAVANGADIINLSLAGDSPNNATLNAALDAAVDAGVIIVIASGNDNNANPQTSTLYALTDGANGQAIIVGATDENDNIWFSPASGDDPASGTNKAGIAQDVFLVAPGEGIVFTCGVVFCTGATGTSLAAPHVSGAIALLLEKFPNLSAAQVVEIILVTAADLGDAGPDAVFGMGLVDLAAAIAPIGQMTIAISGTTSIPINDGSIQVSAAFGDAFTTSPKAQASFGSVLATDIYDRTYTVHLGAMQTARPNSRFDLSQRARSRVYGRHHTIAAPGLGLIEIGYTQRWGALREEDLFPNLNRDSSSRPLNVSFSLYRQLNKHTALSLHHGGAVDDKFLGYQHGATLFAPNDAFMHFAGDGTGASLHQMLNSRTQLSIIGSFADYRPQRNGPALTRTLGAIQLDHLATERLALSLRVGTIDEQGSVLNMVADGAYGVFDKATTVFATFNARYDLTEWSFSLSASFGSTDTGNGNSALLSDLSNFQSTAFSIAARWQTPIAGHYLSFGVSQPLRVENGSVMVNAPTSRDLTTEVFSFSSTELSLSPSAREIDLEIGHLFQGQNGVSLSTNLVYRMNPGHSAINHNAIAFLSHIQFAF